MRKSSQWAIDAMASCLPDDCPLPFEVESAKFVKSNTAIANVKMFDGQPGVLEVFQSKNGGLRLSWKELPGGDINFNGTMWERANKSHRLKQLALAV